MGCSALSGWVTYIHEGVGVEDSLEVVEEIEIFGELLLCSARLLLRRSSCRSVFLFHWAGGGAGSGQRLSPQVQRPPRQMRTSAGAVLRMIIVHLLTLYYFTNAAPMLPIIIFCTFFVFCEWMARNQVLIILHSWWI